MRLRGLARLGWVFLGLWSLLGLLLFAGALCADIRPRLEPLSNLRTHLSVLLVGTGLLWFALGQRRRRGVGVLLCAVGVFGATPALTLMGGGDAVEESAPELRIGSVNLLFGIGHPKPVGEWMAAEDLQVVGFVEMKDSPRSKLRWPKLLESWNADYPYQAIEPHPYYGMALIAKWPLTDVKATYGFGGNGEESERPMRLEATVMFEGRPVHLCLVHPPRPSQTWRGRVRPIFFEQLATELVSAESLQRAEGLVVFGDFNSTEGSPLFQRFVRTAGLRDSRQGMGYCPTWHPGWFPLPLVPLDHILVRGLDVKARGVGSEVRSDHRPIQAILTWPKETHNAPSRP